MGGWVFTTRIAPSSAARLVGPCLRVRSRWRSACEGMYECVLFRVKHGLRCDQCRVSHVQTAFKGVVGG